jgi:4-hydroxybenzoate polyprenyltransferase
MREVEGTTVRPSAGLRAWVKLARVKQWAKSAFVLIGPLYAYMDHKGSLRELFVPALAAAGVLALASSACYVVNDLIDAPKDRLHPRKKQRPIASGAIRPNSAVVFAVLLLVAAGGMLFLLEPRAALWVGLTALVYAVNTNAYSFWLKRIVIADVMCLSLGFVLRVLAGCWAVSVTPSTWLLNCTLFLAMFLSFGKRLGERKTVTDAASVRSVQQAYTDDLLRTSVAVSGVATLITYAGYIQSREALVQHWPFNVLWLTMLPATYGLLRCIVLLEHGRYDDPTELATKDWPTQAAALGFVAITVGVILAGSAR